MDCEWWSHSYGQWITNRDPRSHFTIYEDWDRPLKIIVQSLGCCLVSRITLTTCSVICRPLCRPLASHFRTTDSALNGMMSFGPSNIANVRALIILMPSNERISPCDCSHGTEWAFIFRCANSNYGHHTGPGNWINGRYLDLYRPSKGC